MVRTDVEDGPDASGGRPRPGVRFADRTEAGRRLAGRVGYLRDADVVVLGVPGGGFVVAREVASSLDAPLDAVVVAEIPRPFQPSVAMAAVAEGGVLVVDDAVVNGTHVGLERLAAWDTALRAVVDRRTATLPGRRIPLDGRTALVIADSVVTGLSARAASRVARRRGAAHVVIAAPVVAAAAVAACRREGSEVVWLACPTGTPRPGDYYDESTTTDDVAAPVDRADASPLR